MEVLFEERDHVGARIAVTIARFDEEHRVLLVDQHAEDPDPRGGYTPLHEPCARRVLETCETRNHALRRVSSLADDWTQIVAQSLGTAGEAPNPPDDEGAVGTEP